MRYIGSHNIGSGSNDNSDARARQVEADEMLARELQEQLYNEAPGVGDGEIDTDIALAWQLEDNVFSSGSHPVFNPQIESLEAQHGDALADRSKATETISFLQGLIVEKESKIAEMDAASNGEATQLRAAMETLKGDFIHLEHKHV